MEHIARSVQKGYQYMMNEMGSMIISETSDHLPHVLSLVVLLCYLNQSDITTVRNVISMIEIKDDSNLKTIIKLNNGTKY